MVDRCLRHRVLALLEVCPSEVPGSTGGARRPNQGGIERAQVAQAEAKAALEKNNAELAEARAEAAEIREAARAKGKEIQAELRERAEEESRRIVEAGEKQLLASREQVVAELRNEMGQNSISLAERLLGTELSDDTRRSNTIDAFLAELDNVSTRK